MNILEKVVQAIDSKAFDRFDTSTLVDLVITTFLEAAAEQGWHMRPDEATEQMLFKAHQVQVWSPELGPSIGASQDKAKWLAMNAAAPEFKWKDDS